MPTRAGWTVAPLARAPRFLPASCSSSLYNQVRFGTPLESGYASRRCPVASRLARAGLFALAHIPMNLDYFLLHLPR